jgi:hypothetical protein
MDRTDIDQSVSGAETTTGRRRALGSLGVLGMAFLATLGSSERSSAKTKKGKKKRTRRGPGLAGPQGPGGAQGPGGPQGPEGPEGPEGAAGTPRSITVVTREGAAIAVPANSVKNGEAACNQGEMVTGGGLRLGGADPGCHIFVSKVSSDGLTWVATVSCGDATATSLIPWVRCLKVT